MKFFCIIVGGGLGGEGGRQQTKLNALKSLSELCSLRSQKKIKMNFQFREAVYR